MTNTAIAQNENDLNALPTTQTSGSALVLDLESMKAMNQFAQLMAGGVSTVPKHLQGNTADCMAVIMQSIRWGMDPYAVAQKTHVVSGQLGYEAQLVNAVVSSSTKIQGSFHYDWFGPWERVIGKFKKVNGQNGKSYQAPDWTANDEKGLGVRVWATLRGESEPRVLELLLSQAQVRNSTLWASDPKQQLAYLAVKRWARLYAPDVILGVYSSDELEPASKERELNPRSSVQSKSETLSNLISENKPEKITLSEHAASIEKTMRSAASVSAMNDVVRVLREECDAGLIADAERKYLQGVYAECMTEIKAADDAVNAQSEE